MNRRAGNPHPPVNNHLFSIRVHPRLFLPTPGVMRFSEFFGKFLDQPKWGVELVRQLTELPIIGGNGPTRRTGLVGSDWESGSRNLVTEGERIMTSEKQVAANRENARKTFGEEKGDQNHDV